MNIRIFTLVIVCPFLFGLPNSHALSCAPPDPTSSYYNHDHIFTGKVLRIQEASHLTLRKAAQEDMEIYVMATVAVQTVYKGDVSGNVVVHTNSYWGVPFTKNTEFLIYVNQTEGKLISPLCSGTMMVDYAADQLEVLKLMSDYSLKQAKFEKKDD